MTHFRCDSRCRFSCCPRPSHSTMPSWPWRSGVPHLDNLVATTTAWGARISKKDGRDVSWRYSWYVNRGGGSTCLLCSQGRERACQMPLGCGERAEPHYHVLSEGNSLPEGSQQVCEGLEGLRGASCFSKTLKRQVAAKGDAPRSQSTRRAIMRVSIRLPTAPTAWCFGGWLAFHNHAQSRDSVSPG